MRGVALLLAALLLPCLAVNALYSKGEGVAIVEGERAFQELVIQPEGVSIVEFYAPWCGHCKNLAPHYKTLAQKLKGIMTVAAVDCDDSSNKKLCASNGVRGFPTVKLFAAEKKKNPYTGEWYREATDYSGPRTAKGLMEAATGLLSAEHITRITSVDEFEKFVLTRPGVAKVLLFTSKRDTPVMYKGLSMQMHRGLGFAEVHKDVEDVVAMHEVVDFPTLMVFKADGSGTEVYSGDLKAPQVAEFLQGFASAAADDAGADAAGKASGSDDEEKEAGKPKAQEIQELSLEEAIELDDQEDMWLLGLYSPGEGSDCADSITQFRQAITAMQDVVKVALVTVKPEEVEQVSRYGASPSRLRSQGCALQLVLLPFGQDKADIEDYSVYHGALEGKALQKWVTDATPPTFTTEVNVGSWQYFATMPPPGSKDSATTVSASRPLVRIVLFTNKDEVPGVFKALATNHRSSGFGFGWVQSTQKQNAELMAMFGVKTVPKLAFVTYAPGDKREDGTTIMQPNVGTYRGPLKYQDMASFVSQLAAAFGPKASADADEGMLSEVTDGDALETHCTGKGGICVLAVLNPEAESQHETVMARLTELAVARRGQPFHFAWIDGVRYRGVAKAFGLLRSDLPSVVALSAKRMRFATLPAATDVLGISAFLDGVLGGKVRTDVLDQMPAVLEGGAEAEPAAEEAAAEEPVVEEEFDLSDIMSEEVEGAELGSKGDRLKQVEEQLKAEEEARKAAAKKTKSKKKSKKGKSKSASKSEL